MCRRNYGCRRNLCLLFNEEHTAFGAGAGLVPRDFRVHGAGVDRAFLIPRLGGAHFMACCSRLGGMITEKLAGEQQYDYRRHRDADQGG